MKKIFIDIGVFSLNLATLIALQIVSQFVVFFLYGEGASVDQQYNQWIVIFAAIQVLVILILYVRKILYRRILPVILSIATVITACLYIVLNKS